MGIFTAQCELMFLFKNFSDKRCELVQMSLRLKFPVDCCNVLIRSDSSLDASEKIRVAQHF
jgi:hypothetical protein